MKFITPQRRDQLAAIFTQVLGRPIRVEIEAASVLSAPVMEPPRPGSLQTTIPNRAPSAADRNKALSLTAVRQVMQLFDVAVVGIHTQADSPPIASRAIPAATASAIPAITSKTLDADMETPSESEEEDA